MDGLLTADPFVADEHEDTIEAIWEPREAPEASMIRRSPQTIEVDPGVESPGPRVTMSHEKYLELDRTLHELYALCEIAISQRDEARDQAARTEAERQLYASRLKEWKGYAAGLESRLHAAQIEEIQTSHVAARAADLAEEALALGPFAKKRKAELAQKLAELEIG